MATKQKFRCGVCGDVFDSGNGWFSHVTQVHRDSEEYQKACQWKSENNPQNDGFSEEHRKRISEAKSGCSQPEHVNRYWRENNPSQTESFRERMSGEGNPMKREEVVEKMKQSKEWPSGPNHPRWKGGYTRSSFGENWAAIRNSIRERDGYRCCRCGVHEEDHPTELHVHHIVPRLEFDDPNEANVASNLITLCRSCHFEVEHTGDMEECQ